MISSNFFKQILQVGHNNILFITASLGKLASPSQQCLKDSTIPSQCASESLSVKGPCLSLSPREALGVCRCLRVSESQSLSLSVCATELAVSEAATGGDARRLSPSGCHRRQASATVEKLLPPMYAYRMYEKFSPV